MLKKSGILAGIKVDAGAKPLAGAAGEQVTEGLDGLRERLAEYKKLGATFAKWRAVITIGKDIPSDYCIAANAHALARYAALCQEAGIVPIVEPEVLMDGNHTLERSFDITENTLHALFHALSRQRVRLEHLVLKASMVICRGGLRPAGRRAAGRRRNGAMPETHGAGGGAGDSLPVRRPERRTRDCASECDERKGGGVAVAVVIFLWPRVAGAGAKSLERPARERAGGTKSAFSPRETEQRGLFGPL